MIRKIISLREMLDNAQQLINLKINDIDEIKFLKEYICRDKRRVYFFQVTAAFNQYISLLPTEFFIAIACKIHDFVDEKYFIGGFALKGNKENQNDLELVNHNYKRCHSIPDHWQGIGIGSELLKEVIDYVDSFADNFSISVTINEFQNKKWAETVEKLGFIGNLESMIYRPAKQLSR
ncbi:MAG: hypothetical protein PHV30_11935 [Candidatus Margulisbacteria bacterium]|nr:hypothetical protein [Candidatus Margulisiibacteriota bacterium]